MSLYGVGGACRKGRTEDFAERGGLVVEGVLEDARLGEELGDRLSQWLNVDQLSAYVSDRCPRTRASPRTHLERVVESVVQRRQLRECGPDGRRRRGDRTGSAVPIVSVMDPTKDRGGRTGRTRTERAEQRRGGRPAVAGRSEAEARTAGAWEVELAVRVAKRVVVGPFAGGTASRGGLDSGAVAARPVGVGEAVERGSAKVGHECLAVG